MKTTLFNRLDDDATLTDLLTGGIHDTQTLPERKLTMSYLEEQGKLGSHGQVLPTAALSWGDSQPEDRFRAEMQSVTIWLYVQDDNTVLDDAIRRIKELLHRWHFVTAHESVQEVIYAGAGPEFTDSDLNGANGRFIRFQVRFTRINVV